MSTDAKSASGIYLVRMFSMLLLKDNIGRDDFAEVMQDKTSKDFLFDRIHFLRMRIVKADNMFKLPKSGFDAPPSMIKSFNINRRKFITV